MVVRYSASIAWVLGAAAWLMVSENLLAAETQLKETQPNVIVILTDDQGSVDLGCYGAEDLVTTNIDRIAEQGVRFNQFYAAAPVCSPSRAALLTGKYPQRAGVPGNTTSIPGNPTGMPAEQVTIAEVFSAAGYATGHIGKWHLGYVPEKMPNAQGFDYSFGHMGGCIDNYSHFFYWNGPNRHDLHRNGKEVFHDGEYFPDLMVREAKEFIDRHQDQPFFLYWAINTPHYPYQGEAKWLEHFADLPYPRNLYAAFVASTDERIGQLLDHLEQRELTERTIIVFQSDHGHSTEERAHFGGGNAGPYRAAKFSLFEGGIRVPAMIAWPGTLPKGEVRDQLAFGCDWLPTLAELCKIELPELDLDGRSIVSLLGDANAATPHEVLHWQTGGRGGPQWAVRQGDWKLVVNGRDNGEGMNREKSVPLWLSNLADDPGEETNLAQAHPEIVKRLRELHEAERQRE